MSYVLISHVRGSAEFHVKLFRFIVRVDTSFSFCLLSLSEISFHIHVSAPFGSFEARSTYPSVFLTYNGRLGSFSSKDPSFVLLNNFLRNRRAQRRTFSNISLIFLNEFLTYRRAQCGNNFNISLVFMNDSLTYRGPRGEEQKLSAHEHGRLLTESSCLPFILTSMGGLCEEGHEFLRVCRKRNPEKTKHLFDVLVTQHSRWVASRMRRSLFDQATSTAV